MRTIVTCSLYDRLASEIANTDELKDSVSALMWGLQNNAEDFPIIPGYKTLRMAKTDAVRGIPALRLVFKIGEEDDQVHLKWIEVARTDEFEGPPIL
jgi:hypothetical protein